MLLILLTLLQGTVSFDVTKLPRCSLMRPYTEVVGADDICRVHQARQPPRDVTNASFWKGSKLL